MSCPDRSRRSLETDTAFFVTTTDGVLRWVLWVGAGLALVYLIVTGWRVYRRHEQLPALE